MVRCHIAIQVWTFLNKRQNVTVLYFDLIGNNNYTIYCLQLISNRIQSIVLISEWIVTNKHLRVDETRHVQEIAINIDGNWYGFLQIINDNSKIKNKMGEIL